MDGLTERNSPPFGGDLSLAAMGVDPVLQWAGARAHNRWMAEFAAQCPERRNARAILVTLGQQEQQVLGPLYVQPLELLGKGRANAAQRRQGRRAIRRSFRGQ